MLLVLPHVLCLCISHIPDHTRTQASKSSPRGMLGPLRDPPEASHSQTYSLLELPPLFSSHPRWFPRDPYVKLGPKAQGPNAGETNLKCTQNDANKPVTTFSVPGDV